MQPNFDALYRSIVTANVDTSGAGKIKVQCPQIAGMAEIRSAEPVNPGMPVPAVGSIVWVGFSGGDMTKPYYMANKDYLTLDTNGSNLIAVSPTKGTSNDGAQFILVSGVDGANTGGAVPHVTFRDVNGTTFVDLHLSGNVIPVDNAGNVLHWQTPTMQTGWATGPASGGGSFPPLQWRYGDADDVWVFGSFHATIASPTSLIATGFPHINIVGPLGGVGVMAGMPRVAGGNATMGGYLNDTGQMRSQTAPTISINDTFIVNSRVPLGNLS